LIGLNILRVKVIKLKTITETNTLSNSYTKSRIEVLNDHFEMFLRCSDLSDSDVEKLLESADKQEISAVGIYIEEKNYRIAEVEFAIDWLKHNDLVKTRGKVFDTDLAGWKNGIAPEAYISAQRLVNYAKQMRAPVRSWIRVSQSIRADTEKHKQVCTRLGYCYGNSVAPWENEPDEKTRYINGLEEAKVTCRVHQE